MKTLNKKAKHREATKQLKEEIKNGITANLLKKLDAAINSGAIPEHWMEEGSHLLSKAIIHSFCLDKPYEMFSKDHRKDAENIHLFI
jgi:hypothetical protein